MRGKVECDMEHQGTLILASGSPRRRELLAALGWPFTVCVPQVDEGLLPGEGAEVACERLARTKGRSVASLFPSSWVVAADTLVVVDGTVLGKPRTDRSSLEMLRMLQGRSHWVLTGVAVCAAGRTESAVERTRVTFRPLSEEDMAAYVESGEGDDKAGAYAIQGLGSLMVSSIEGDYFNVVGLPMCRLGRIFEALGRPLAEQWRRGE
jgi:septum formation protein